METVTVLLFIMTSLQAVAVQREVLNGLHCTTMIVHRPVITGCVIGMSFDEFFKLVNVPVSLMGVATEHFLCDCVVVYTVINALSYSK